MIKGKPREIGVSLPFAEEGLCRTTNGDWFDLPNVGSVERQKVIKRKEIAICRACPVRRECLEHALEFNEPAGIWGG